MFDSGLVLLWMMDLRNLAKFQWSECIQGYSKTTNSFEKVGELANIKLSIMQCL